MMVTVAVAREGASGSAGRTQSTSVSSGSSSPAISLVGLPRGSQAGEGDVMADLPARSTDLAQQADAFCEASIRDTTGRAVRMLAAIPELAGYNFATTVILGDAGRVRAEIARDPGLATRVDARTGWTPLHAACASNWHRLDPARAGGLLAVARIILDAGADPNGRSGGPRGGWTPLRCAVAGSANPPVVALLLERGA